MWVIVFIFVMGLDLMLFNLCEDYCVILSRMYVLLIFEIMGLGKCGYEKISNVFRVFVMRYGM